MVNKNPVIGTRGSQLALYQANRIKELLTRTIPGIMPEIKIIKTKGDKILDTSLSKIGDKGLFTKELEIELQNGNIDMAVHSLKDMPTELPQGLKLGAVIKRGDVQDALVSKNNKKLIELTPDDKIATSSLRRKASLLHYNKDFQIVDIRGNVNTRLQKMINGYCDAIIMAYTGLKRLSLEHYVTELLPMEQFIPAVSQGAIGIETVDCNPELDTIMQQINHRQTWECIIGERAFMRTLEGGCQVPVGCYSTLENNTLSLTGFIASVDGKKYLKENISGNVNTAEKLGEKLANSLLNKGGQEILSCIRSY